MEKIDGVDALAMTLWCGHGVATARRSKSFFASFFSKKEVLTSFFPALRRLEL
jgi:hypothetical protein